MLHRTCLGKKRIMLLDAADASVGTHSWRWIMSPAIVHSRGFPCED